MEDKKEDQEDLLRKNKNNPKFNPGVKGDRTRLIIIVIVGLLLYWMYTAIQDFIQAIPPETLKPDKIEEPIYPESTDSNESDSFKVFDFNTTKTATINTSGLSDEEAKRILEENEDEIMKQLTDQGLDDQAEAVKKALKEMKETL